ncbi:MAG: glycerate-2-kinase family protein, partial [Chloroflexota bacterium]|nr:glycerate-2-kinase family protein [Chloroflexota bacterium]
MEPGLDPAVVAIKHWFEAAVAAAEPAAAVRRHLLREGRTLVVSGRGVPVTGRMVLAAVGKAAVAMACGAAEAAGELVTEGIVVTKDGLVADRLTPGIRVFEASHPVPDERGVRATREALAMVRRLSRGDVLLALISGGGSALLEAPRPPVTLAEMAATTDLLLRAGAPIEDLNAVRTPLSLVKGGGLRRAAGDAVVVTLILSDVLGNDPRVIASGPTIPAVPDAERALAVLGRYGLLESVPRGVVEVLTAAKRPTDSHDAGGDVVTVVGDNAAAVDAARRATIADHRRPSVV